jgi:hypothetical protein
MPDRTAVRTTVFLQFSIVVLFSFFSCQSSSLGMAGTIPPSHQLWDELLKSSVRADGTVDYRAFIHDKTKLDQYLKLLSGNPPDRDTWSRDEQIAYWINAYNAFTVKLIVDHYPVKSIRDLGPTLKIPLINDVWHSRFFKIGGVETSLDHIEHGILRKEFDEPRIHFAINCASVSCPPLSNEAFSARTLDAQLNQAAHTFINDPKRNILAPEQIKISSIFSWFEEDFTKAGSLIDFLNRYAKVKIKASAKISYLEYDWRLND